MFFSKKKQDLELDKDGKVVGMSQSEEAPVPPVFKKKRDIFRFKGEKDMGLNLEHVTNMFVEGKRITFQFYSTSSFIDMEDEQAAQNAYEQLLGVWAADQ